MAAAGIDLLQAAEHADAVIDVHHQVTGFQLRELLQRECLRVLAEAFLQPVAVVALEDLVVGVEREFQLGSMKPSCRSSTSGVKATSCSMSLKME
jgi:hypothetical protein